MLLFRSIFDLEIFFFDRWNRLFGMDASYGLRASCMHIPYKMRLFFGRMLCSRQFDKDGILIIGSIFGCVAGRKSPFLFADPVV